MCSHAVDDVVRWFGDIVDGMGQGKIYKRGEGKIHQEKPEASMTMTMWQLPEPDEPYITRIL